MSKIMLTKEEFEKRQMMQHSSENTIEDRRDLLPVVKVIIMGFILITFGSIGFKFFKGKSPWK